jgi:hypothetical protein
MSRYIKGNETHAIHRSEEKFAPFRTAFAAAGIREYFPRTMNSGIVVKRAIVGFAQDIWRKMSMALRQPMRHI